MSHRFLLLGKAAFFVFRTLRRFTVLWAALGLAALLQCVLLIRSPVIARDGVAFIDLARGAISYQTLSTSAVEPGYPLLIRGAHALIEAAGLEGGLSSWILAARALPFLFGLIAVVLVALISTRLLGEEAGAAAALIFAAIPVFRESAIDALSDTPHLFFYLLAVWLAVEGLAPRRRVLLWAAGLAGGAAFWIRTEGLVVALALGVFLLARGRGREGTRHRLGAVAGLLLAAALPAAPLLFLTQAWVEKAGSIHHLLEAGISGIFVELVRSLGAMAEKASTALRYVLLLPLAAGVVAARRLPATAQTRFVSLLFCAQLGVVLLQYQWSHSISSRHGIPLIALAMPWIGLGVVELGRHLQRGPRVRWALVGVFLALLVPRAVRPAHRDDLPVVEAARWVGTHMKEDEWALSNSIYTPFYGEVISRVIGEGESISEAEFPGGAPYRFAVLDTRAGDYSPVWRWQLSHHYREVDGPWQEHGVLVLQARGR